MTSPLESYLSRFERELAKRGLVDARIVEEVRGHLVDAIEHAIDRGLANEAAEREAFERFGTPEAVAAKFANERLRGRNWWMLLVATIAGLSIAYVDSRPAWDDTAVTAFSLMVSAGVLGMLAPQRPWLWALAVGIWIPVHAVVHAWTFSSLGMFAVLAFPLAGAYVGILIGRILNAQTPSIELFALTRPHYHDIPDRTRQFHVRIKPGALKRQPALMMNATDARDQLAAFLTHPEMVRQAGALESLTLLAETVELRTNIRKYEASFAGGAKMVWTVEHRSDGTIRSIDGTSAAMTGRS
jgi:hypothetical protein